MSVSPRDLKVSLVFTDQNLEVSVTFSKTPQNKFCGNPFRCFQIEYMLTDTSKAKVTD